VPIAEAQERASQASQLRHIFGNPFQSLAAPEHWPSDVRTLAAAYYAGEFRLRTKAVDYQFMPGDRVTVMPNYYWAQGAHGTIEMPPATVRHPKDQWIDHLRRVTGHGSTVDYYWVEFDQPQYEPDPEHLGYGDRFWSSAEIQARCLQLIQKSNRMLAEESLPLVDELKRDLRQALEKCGQTQLAEHFSSPFSHPNGCWALDMILGKN